MITKAITKITMKLRYYICALEHLFVLSGLFWHLQIIFDITGHILDCLKWTFITKLKEWNGENSDLVFAPGISDTIQYAIFLEGHCQETAEF